MKKNTIKKNLAKVGPVISLSFGIAWSGLMVYLYTKDVQKNMKKLGDVVAA